MTSYWNLHTTFVASNQLALISTIPASDHHHLEEEIDRLFNRTRTIRATKDCGVFIADFRHFVGI